MVVRRPIEFGEAIEFGEKDSRGCLERLSREREDQHAGDDANVGTGGERNVHRKIGVHSQSERNLFRLYEPALPSLHPSALFTNHSLTYSLTNRSARKHTTPHVTPNPTSSSCKYPSQMLDTMEVGGVGCCVYEYTCISGRLPSWRDPVTVLLRLDDGCGPGAGAFRGGRWLQGRRLRDWSAGNGYDRLEHGASWIKSKGSAAPGCSFSLRSSKHYFSF